MIESREGVGAGLKKVGSLLRSGIQKRNQGLVPVTAWNRAVKIIKFVTVTVGPLFFQFGHRKSYQIRDLYFAFRIINIKGILIWIKIAVYTNSIIKKCRVWFRIVPWKSLISTLIHAELFQRTNAPDGRIGKPEVNQNTALFPKTLYKFRAK